MSDIRLVEVAEDMVRFNDTEEIVRKDNYVQIGRCFLDAVIIDNIYITSDEIYDVSSVRGPCITVSNGDDCEVFWRIIGGKFLGNGVSGAYIETFRNKDSKIPRVVVRLAGSSINLCVGSVLSVALSGKSDVLYVKPSVHSAWRTSLVKRWVHVTYNNEVVDLETEVVYPVANTLLGSRSFASYIDSVVCVNGTYTEDGFNLEIAGAEPTTELNTGIFVVRIIGWKGFILYCTIEGEPYKLFAKSKDLPLKLKPGASYSISIDQDGHVVA